MVAEHLGPLDLFSRIYVQPGSIAEGQNSLGVQPRTTNLYATQKCEATKKVIKVVRLLIQRHDICTDKTVLKTIKKYLQSATAGWDRFG